jgi:hypothetical protein
MTLAKSNYDALWTQDGAFSGADGKSIRAYDDVALLREAPIESSQFETKLKTAPAGTTGTVLFFTPGPDGVAQLELNLDAQGLCFAIEETRFLRLHMTNEEKYPR